MNGTSGRARGLLAALLLGGCATVRPAAPAASGVSDEGEGERVNEGVNEGELILVLADGSLLSAAHARPQGFYLRVQRIDGRLEPAREVEGGELEPAGGEQGGGQPGWYELWTRRFVPSQAAQAPQGPYVEGTMTAAGFRPTSRTVFR